METKHDKYRWNPFATKRTVPLGEVRMTAGVERDIDPYDVVTGISRHARCDWGDLDAHDIHQNEYAYQNGGRLISQYTASTGKLFWVITEYDRSVTTVLLPEEY